MSVKFAVGEEKVDMDIQVDWVENRIYPNLRDGSALRERLARQARLANLLQS